MNRALLSFAVIVFLAFSDGTMALEYTDCGSTANVHKVAITGCESGRICPLKRGSDVQLNLEFTPTTSHRYLMTVVKGKLSYLPMAVPYAIPQNNACRSGVKCPVVSGRKQTYSTYLPIKKMYPKVPVKVYWRLVDPRTYKTVVCLEVMAEIQD